MCGEDNKVCPLCRSEEVTEIVYGYPSSEMRRKAISGKIVLGMDVVKPDSDKWRCDECGFNFGTVENYPEDYFKIICGGD